jgi:hypothetical protein
MAVIDGKCSKCGSERAPERRCKECRRRADQRYRDDPVITENRRVRAKEYYETPERKAWQKDYFRNYYKTENGIIRRIIGDIKFRCKKAGIEFDIDYDHLRDLANAQEYACALSGIKFVFGAGEKIPAPMSASLDRVDPFGGYVKGNVQWVCYSMNAAKQQMTMAEFEDFMSQTKWAKRPMVKAT